MEQSVLYRTARRRADDVVPVSTALGCSVLRDEVVSVVI